MRDLYGCLVIDLPADVCCQPTQNKSYSDPDIDPALVDSCNVGFSVTLVTSAPCIDVYVVSLIYDDAICKLASVSYVYIVSDPFLIIQCNYVVG